MSRYADPRRCPDCAGAIDPGTSPCPSCGLLLTGENAHRLFTTLTAADELLSALRADSVPLAAPAAPTPAASAIPTTAFPTTAGRAPRRRGLSAASVPQILLPLGAGCLLVAALVFLAVTWSVLGVGGRTAALVGCTVLAAAATRWMAGRALRAAAESLGLVALGLLALDVLGANSAGWFGDLSQSGLLLVLGGILALAGTAAAVAVRASTPVSLVGAEAVAAAGTGLATLGVLTADWLPFAPTAVLATVVAAATTAVLHRLRLRVAAAGAAGATALAWLALAGDACIRAADNDTWRELWLDREVWPLLVAAALVAAVALLRGLPVVLRVSAVALANPLLALALVLPLLDETPTEVTIVAIAVLAVLGVATWWMPRPWGLAHVGTQTVAVAGLLSVVGRLSGRSLDRLADAAAAGWAGAATDRLAGAGSPADLPAGWLLPVCVLALVGTAWALAEESAFMDRLVAIMADLRLGAGVLAAAVVLGMASYPVPVWPVVAVLVLLTGAFTAWWFVGGSVVPLVPAGLFLLAAVGVSLHAETLTLATLLVAVGVAGLGTLRGTRELTVAVAAGLLGVSAGGAVWAAGAVADVTGGVTALAGLLLLGALVLGAPFIPSGWWAVPSAVARRGLDAGAGMAALGLGAAGAGSTGHPPTWAALYLTVAGAVVTLLSLLVADRRSAGWLGGALLALASWVRLADLGVHAPEAYTLPTAAALLVAGLVRLHRHPATTTTKALGAGLSLALVPSLLWALEEPTGLRPVLLGLACLVLVLAGARLGWTAPIAAGALVGGVLVVRLAAPYIGDAVPRWALIAAAGALLVGVGATWERRVQEARQVVGVIRSLR